MLPLAEYLAERGFISLLPDAWGHGDRFPTSGPNWMTELSADYFLDVLRHTVANLPTCLSALELRPDVRADALLVAGFSMGAMAALLVGTADPRVAGVISASGSAAPDLVDITIAGSRPASAATRAWAVDHDVATHLGKLAPRPLLLQHGRRDDMIPSASTLRLHECALPHYSAYPERLSLMLYDHTHTTSPRQIEDAVEWITPFFMDGAEE
jgi:dienelactone hydrolase